MKNKIILAKDIFIDPSLYFGELMSLMYSVIIASEPLLELAIEKSTGKLKEYMLEHREEERDHAIWLKDDLKELGIDADELPYNEVVAGMVGSQYYILNYRNPVMFLGYMLFLESHPMHPLMIKRLELLYGEKAVRTLKYHSVHDVDHAEDLNKVIDDLSEEDKALVLVNAQQTADYYAMATRKIRAEKQFDWQRTNHG